MTAKVGSEMVGHRTKGNGLRGIMKSGMDNKRE